MVHRTSKIWTALPRKTYLHRQLAGRRNDDDTQTVLFGPPLAVKALQSGNQERERLSRASLGTTQNVTSRKSFNFRAADTPSEH